MEAPEGQEEPVVEPEDQAGKLIREAVMEGEETSRRERRDNQINKRLAILVTLLFLLTAGTLVILIILLA